MAYNPFNIFRRNQKAIFAVVTVFIMFTFVLSSGLGGGADFFDWLPRWLGSKGKRGDVLCTIDGTKIYENDLTEAGRGLRYRRVMANKYMSLAAMVTTQQLDGIIREQLNRTSPEAERIIKGFLQAEGQIGNPQFGMLPPLYQQQFLEQRNKLHAQVQSLARGPVGKPEDREVAQALLGSMAISATLSQAMRSGSPEHYFVLAPNRTQTDLINFMLWQKKADQLGINFTTADVKALIEREMLSSFGARAQVDVQKAMAQSMPGFTMDACLKAVGEELRVRTAQSAVLGGDVHTGRGDSYGGFPAFNTPYDAFEYFREHCSPTTYGVIPVSLASFMDKVENPNLADPKVKDELKNLYQQYKDDEPDPRKETPGFREPRKVRVEYFSVNGSEPYYKQLAAESLKLGEPVAKTGSMLTVPVFGISPATIATAVAPVAVKDALVEAEYDLQHARMHRSEVNFRWSRPGFDSVLEAVNTPLGLLLETSVVRPGNLGVAVGAMGGQLAGFGNPFAAAAAMGTGPIAYEIRDRIKAGIPLILGATPTLGGFSTILGGEAAYRTMVPKPLPIEAYRASLLTELIDRNARELALKDVQTFIKEVKKLSEDVKAKDKAPAQKYIDEFIARRGLKVQGNTVPRSEWTLEEDAALAPLLAAQRDSLRAAAGAHARVNRGYVPFGERFFWTSTPMGRNPATGTFTPMPYPNEMQLFEDDLKTKTQFVVWRKTDDVAKPRLWSDDPNSELLKDVIRAWKRNKARELAKNAAEQLAQTIRASSGDSEGLIAQNLRDLAQKHGDPFVIRGVAPLTTVADPTGEKGFELDRFMPSMPGPVTDFMLRPSENMRYPTNEIGKTLLSERTKPAKTVLVLPDAPKDTFYVATIVKREVKGDLDYKIEVSGELGERFGGPVVLGRFKQQGQVNAYKSIIGLLQKEFKYVVTDEQKKKLEENEKRGIDN